MYSQSDVREGSSPNAWYRGGDEQKKKDRVFHQKWWNTGSQYDFDLRNKLKEEGCREEKRKLVECRNKQN